MRERHKIIFDPSARVPWRVYYDGEHVGSCLTGWGARYRLGQVRRRYRKAARMSRKANGRR